MAPRDIPLMEVVGGDGGLFSFDDGPGPADTNRNSWQIEIIDDDIYWDGEILVSRHADSKKLGKIIKRTIAKSILETE